MSLSHETRRKLSLKRLMLLLLVLRQILVEGRETLTEEGLQRRISCVGGVAEEIIRRLLGHVAVAGARGRRTLRLPLVGNLNGRGQTSVAVGGLEKCKDGIQWLGLLSSLPGIGGFGSG